MARMSVRTFDRWCPALDEAVAGIPEDVDWPHELYRLLVETAAAEPLRIVMWTERDSPVGVIAFRPANRIVWEPVTQWVVPGCIGIVQPGRIAELVERVPFRARIAWWRVDSPPPQRGYVRSVTRESTHGIPYPYDFEAYWRKTGILNKVRRARKRCEELELSINAPGAHEWVIRHAEEHWNLPQGTQLASRLAVASHLLAMGRYFSYTLNAGERIIAGTANIVHRNDIVGHVMYRDRDAEYDKHGIGNFLMDVLFRHAQELHKGVDLGGSYSYKHRWAPEAGEKAYLHVTPPLSFVAEKATSGLKRLTNVITRMSRGQARGEVAAAAGSLEVDSSKQPD
jgi:Acetyltransferase (GNAT) domain